MPTAAIGRPGQVDLLKVANAHQLHAPIYSGSGWGHRFNFDGFVTFTPSGGGRNWSYLQFFRDGTIEAVTTAFFLSTPASEGGVPRLVSGDLERELVDFCRRLPTLLDPSSGPHRFF